MSENKMTHAELEERLTVAPFHKWLGLKLLSMDEDGIKVGVTWREEFVVNPAADYTHGGILAMVIDIAADYALAAKLGRPIPTVDLRVDYHRAARAGDLVVEARPIKLGGSFCTAEAYVYDANGKLLASGRGVYFSAPPK
jgi:uncharacterized protein (TIGR00369 family)